MKLFLMTFWVTFCLDLVVGQCPTGTIVLYNQEDVENFGANWPNCKHLPGSLSISGIGVTDLTPLSGLITVGHNLKIVNTHSANFLGLDSLKSVGGNLILNNNDYILNLSDLSSLVSVGGDFEVEYNSGLATLTGIENIAHIGGDFTILGYFDDQVLPVFTNLDTIGGGMIIGNTNLLSLEGLENINTIGGQLKIYNNDLLVNLGGLDGLNTVSGLLTVRANLNLTSLMGLNSIDFIGELFIDNNHSLENIADLDGLSTIEGNIQISNNPVLLSLVGLGSVSSVQRLYVANNKALTSLIGLEGIHDVGGDIFVRLNKCLKDLAPLSNIDSIGGYLEIESNDSLISLVGLQNVVYIGGKLDINDNPELLSLIELQNITSIGGGLFIERNNLIENLEGLNNIGAINGSLQIRLNNHLESLQGLESISSISNNVIVYSNNSLLNLSALNTVASIGGMLKIYNNPDLSVCGEIFVCEYLQSYNPVSQSVFIQNNAEGCQSIEDVFFSCSNQFSAVTGVVYIDFDCDSVFDNNDIQLANYLIRKADGTPFSTTNSIGEYARLLLPNSVNTLNVVPLPGYFSQPSSYQLITDTAVLAYTDYNFRLCPDSIFSDANVSIAALNVPRPGFSNPFHVCYQNVGTQPTNATLTLTFSGDAAAYLTITDAAGGTVSGNAITWELMDIPVFGQGCFMVAVELTPETPLGSLLVADADISVVNGVIASSFQNIQTVVGSYDPNDKSVSPKEIDFTTADGPQRLTYTVRFQNTGTFPATFVEVLDTLEANLDIKTLQLLSASHAYTLTVLDDHILKFRFDDINLPDSTSDEPNSHGYIMFSLATVDGLQLGDVVSNSVAIYFDYNEPVITNTATTEYVLPLSASYSVTHETDGQSNGSISVTAVGGLPPYQYSIDCDVANFGANSDFNALSQGWYCIRTRDAAGHEVMDSIYVDNIVATDNMAMKDIQLNPNPARNSVQVMLSPSNSTMHIELLNTLGSVLQRHEVSGSSLTLDVSGLPHGVYIVRATSSTAMGAVRLVKE